jgi:hypothetical protein
VSVGESLVVRLETLSQEFDTACADTDTDTDTDTRQAVPTRAPLVQIQRVIVRP